MPVLLFVAVFCALIGAGALVYYKTDRHREPGGLAIGVGFIALAAVLLGLASTTIVGTRNIGIVTTFGKPTGTLSNGLHLIAPWQKVPELSGTIHTDSQVGGWRENRCDGGTSVRLANGSTACVDNTIRWRLVPNAADDLFRDYQNDERIRESLVTRELNAALSEVFAGYNPLDATAPKLPDLSAAVTSKVQAKIKNQIDVQNVIVALVHFDVQTQDRINAVQAQLASTRIAEESQRTAAAQAQANKALADSVSRDPNVLVARCLELVASGHALPVGFQCWPGSGLPVTIPAR